jgi:hypothetical protein
MKPYLRIDEKENAVDSLQRATEFLKNTESDPLYWKWFIVAIHHAIYHFMLLALQNSNGSGIWREPKKLVNLRLSREVVDTENPKNKIVDFKEAFDRIQETARMSGNITAKPFIANNEHKKAAACLNTILRNNFAHFSPKGWSIEISFIIDAVSPMLEVIEFLVLNSGRLFMDEQQRNGIQSNITKIRLFFDSCEI